jgi:hypothetical protein
VRNRLKYVLITYETLGDYLWLLKGISQELSCVGGRAMLYLAAAVSDFYVPKDDMVQKLGKESRLMKRWENQSESKEVSEWVI